MNCVFAILLSIVPLLAWNKIRLLLTPDGAEAALHEGPGLRGAVMRYVVLRLKASALTEGEFIALSFIGGLFFVGAGFFCDAMLGDRAFGAKGNSGILLTGAVVSADRLGDAGAERLCDDWSRRRFRHRLRVGTDARRRGADEGLCGDALRRFRERRAAAGPRQAKSESRRYRGDQAPDGARGRRLISLIGSWAKLPLTPAARYRH